MANINELLARAAALRDETQLNSISPERAGGIMYDTLLAMNELWLQQGAALVISKIYASVSAMEADTAPVSDLTGLPLRPGQIVVIASSDSDNGSVYRYNGTSSPSWSLVGEIGNLEPVDSLDSDSTSLPLAAHQGKVLDGKISQLGQGLTVFEQASSPQGSLQIENPMEGSVKYSLQFTLASSANSAITLRSTTGGSAPVSQTISESKTWSAGVNIVSFDYSGGTYLRFDNTDAWTNISNIKITREAFKAEELYNLLKVDCGYDGLAGNYIDGNYDEIPSANYDISGYIEVATGDYVFYSGRQSLYPAIVGYDENKENPSTILAGVGQNKTCFVIIPSGVKYIRAVAANSNHSDFSGRSLSVIKSQDYINILKDELQKNAVELSNIKSALTDKTKIYLNADNSGGYFWCGGVDDAGAGDYYIITSCNTLLNEIKIYDGYGGGSNLIRTINASSIEQVYNNYIIKIDKFVVLNSDIASGAKYLRTNIQVDTNFSCYKEFEQQKVEKLEAEVYSGIKIYSRRVSNAGNSIWCEVVGYGKTYIKSTTPITNVKLFTERIATSTLVREITSDQIISIGNNVYEFEVTEEDLSSGAAYFRTAGGTYLGFECYIVSKESNIKLLEEKTGSLFGKKIAVIGDSISTILYNNTPYWTVLPIDVGNTIESYVTWWDVYNDQQGNQPTNKSIGGVTLTQAMIGTKQTFTPISDDIGKQIGVSSNFNPEERKVWSEIVCDKTGALLLANASWSGSRMCEQPGDIYTLSEAWNDYTIGCCKVRDSAGNDVVPDIIIIYRGTNDFSHIPYSRLDEISLANGVPESDYIDGNYEFKAGYYKTIQKLREAYPKAYIFCCTLNVFKRIIYDKFPTRNGINTLPEMNNAIRSIADTMGCGLIEFDKDGVTFENIYPDYSSETDIPTHPNNNGHIVLADKAISDMTYYLKKPTTD